MSKDDLIRESVSTTEEDVRQIQEDIDKINKEKEHIRQRKILLNKKQELLEEKYELEEESQKLEKGERSKRPLLDVIGLGNVVLLVIMVLLSGALMIERGAAARFAAIPLIAVVVLVCKMVSRAGGI